MKRTRTACALCAASTRCTGHHERTPDLEANESDEGAKDMAPATASSAATGAGSTSAVESNAPKNDSEDNSMTIVRTVCQHKTSQAALLHARAHGFLFRGSERALLYCWLIFSHNVHKLTAEAGVTASTSGTVHLHSLPWQLGAANLQTLGSIPPSAS